MTKFTCTYCSTSTRTKKSFFVWIVNCYFAHHVTTFQDSSLIDSKIKLCLLVACLGAEDTLAGNPRCIPLIQFPLWPEKNNNLKQNSRPSSDILFHLVIRAQTSFKNISILRYYLVLETK